MAIFQQLTIIGCGLIGSSLAHAVQRKKLCAHIIAYDKNHDHSEKLVSLNVAHRSDKDIKNAIKGSDLVIICTPVGIAPNILADIHDAVDRDAIISDVGSIKQYFVERSKNIITRDDLYFIPAHPIAGTEKSGPEAGFASLFDDKYCILTPINNHAHHDKYQEKLQQYQQFWQECGAIIDIMDAYHHDRVLAITSHLPHLIAYTITGTASDLEQVMNKEQVENDDIVSQHDVIKYAAGGFRDFTRIAASDPVMWRDIFLHNKAPILEMIGRFEEDLHYLRRAIRNHDGDMLQEWFERTRTIRKSIEAINQAKLFD